MKNFLHIQGTDIAKLVAAYKNRSFEQSKITGGITKGHAGVIFHFASRLTVPADGLNVILLMTDCKGTYKATGLSAYDRGDGKPQFYTLSDDLEIRVDPSADKVIRNLRHSYETIESFNKLF